LGKELTAAEPSVTDYVSVLGSSYEGLGKIERDAGQPEAALKWYGEAIQDLAGLLAQNAQDLTVRNYQRGAYQGRAAALGQLGRHAEALADLDKVIELSDQKQRPRVRLSRTVVLARAGNYDQAVTEADELAKANSPAASSLYELACVYSLASAAAGKDTKLTVAKRTERAKQYGAHAVELLTAAHGAGYFKEPKNLDAMKKDTDLDPLRDRADFKKLFAEL